LYKKQLGEQERMNALQSRNETGQTTGVEVGGSLNAEVVNSKYATKEEKLHNQEL
jgi:fucose permease